MDAMNFVFWKYFDVCFPSVIALLPSMLLYFITIHATCPEVELDAWQHSNHNIHEH